MKKISWFSLYLLLYAVAVAFCSSCSDDESPLRNDLLRKDVGPVLVGNTLEFAYAIGSTDGTPIKQWRLQRLSRVPKEPGLP